MNLPFHLLAAAGLAATLVSILRSASPPSAFRFALRYGAFGVLASLLTARALPELPALAAWGLFLYAPLGLVVVAIGLARRRGRATRVGALLCALASCGLVAVAVQAFFIEPRSLEVNRVVVESANVAGRCASPSSPTCRPIASGPTSARRSAACAPNARTSSCCRGTTCRRGAARATSRSSAN